MSKKITVEIVSDLVCPWCYVGKRRLDKAIGERPDLDISVVWQPFQLSPDMPREGKDRLEHYSQIFGEKRAQQIMASMRDTGEEEGIAFDYKPGARSPNTLAAHALMLMAREVTEVDADELAEKLFQAHHVDCEDVGDLDVLMRIGAEVGMHEADLRSALPEAEQGVQALIQTSVERGVSGVPFYIINGRYGVSGAQPTGSLVAVFDQVNEADDPPNG